ncbi:TPA: 30S ribosomal protein S27ae [Candidatus Woesearchaeota archaeon]|nr:30S ribosomal protein S27ae [Candidatus Woesearchaeota archaeon]
MAKKQKKPRKPMQVWKIYDSKSGALTRKTVSCPKCGPGVFLGKHASRRSCGKCGYAEMQVKKQ